MDEMWQRHKSFILQLIVGGVVFLVAFLVMRSMYGDANDPERMRGKNATTLENLRNKAKDGHAPSASTIATQKDIAARGEATKWEFLKHVSSVAGREAGAKESEREMAYVRESIQRALANLGKTDDGSKLELFRRLPQTCLSAMLNDARRVLAGKAAQSGKEIDEGLGIATGFPTDEIPEVLQGFDVVTDVVARCLAKPNIDKIQAIRIQTHSMFPESNDVHFVSAVDVHLELIGDPAEIADVIRSFNSVNKKDQRMIVVNKVDSIVPLGADEDTVKASITLVGLRYKSEVQE